MSALICGSFAFDTIMVFRDQFKNHILPDQVHILNVSFLVPDMRREFGGCAGNIAYTLKLLGGDPLPMGTIGTDFITYADWMDECDIPRTHLKELPGTYTGQAFITTDLDDNQITAFHPGAMSMSHENKVSDATGVTVGIVSPDGAQGMIDHAEQFTQAGIPFVFDPGQGMPMFDGNQLKKFIEQATWATLNDYEAKLLQEKTGESIEELAGQVKALIVTRGAKGSRIYTDNKMITIPAVETKFINDPTGCGDAYRAGLLYGIMNELDWETTGQIAALAGAIKIAHHGTQNHSFTVAEFKDQFQTHFGKTF
jgi:adenosine kinase